MGSNPTPDNVVLFSLFSFFVFIVWIQRPCIECYGSQNRLKPCRFELGNARRKTFKREDDPDTLNQQCVDIKARLFHVVCLG